MSWKTDKFTAARIRLFHATGMAKQKPLPFDRPRTSGSARMMAGELRAAPQHTARSTSRPHAS